MSIAQTVLIIAVIALVLFIGITETQKRRRLRKKQRAFIRAQRLLRRLRCEVFDPAHHFKSTVRARCMVVLLEINCEEAGITLDELGMSPEELDKLCGRHTEGLLDK